MDKKLFILLIFSAVAGVLLVGLSTNPRAATRLTYGDTTLEIRAGLIYPNYSGRSKELNANIRGESQSKAGPNCSGVTTYICGHFDSFRVSLVAQEFSDSSGSYVFVGWEGCGYPYAEVQRSNCNIEVKKDSKVKVIARYMKKGSESVVWASASSDIHEMDISCSLPGDCIVRNKSYGLTYIPSVVLILKTTTLKMRALNPSSNSGYRYFEYWTDDVPGSCIHDNNPVCQQQIKPGDFNKKVWTALYRS